MRNVHGSSWRNVQVIFIKIDISVSYKIKKNLGVGVTSVYNLGFGVIMQQRKNKKNVKIWLE